MDTYVEFPLLFNIQNEGLSAFYEENVAAREAALGRKLNQKGPNFIVRRPHSDLCSSFYTALCHILLLFLAAGHSRAASHGQ